MNNFAKRFISAVLSIVMVLGTLTAVAAADYPFSDFPDGWSKAAVSHAVDNGLLTGMGDGTIAPKGNLTRAQMAAIINRAFGATVMADISGFTDVPADAWYRDDIALALNMETFSGSGDGLMNPDADITRQEAFAVLSRALVLEGNSWAASSFTDAASVSEWAKEDVGALVSNGYVNGYPDGSIDPLGSITREEFAQVMYNIFGTYISAEGVYLSVASEGGVMINHPGVTLKNVTINGDLVLGDGVGNGSVTLENVIVNGRILCRGGEDKVTLMNVTTTGGVVVKDVNGIVNFNNYKTEAVFAGVREVTEATYLPLFNNTDKVFPNKRPSSYSPSTPSVSKVTVKVYDDSSLSILITTIRVDENTKLLSKLPSAPSKDGFVFDGWYYKKGGVEYKVDSSTAATANMVVYAKWVSNVTSASYIVKHVRQSLDGTYNSVALTETETKNGTIGQLTAAAAKTYSGFTAETFSQETIKEDNSTVVTIKYKRNSYTIKFNSNGGSAVADIVKLYEENVTKPADPTKDGYTFAGWYTDAALTVPYSFSTMPLGGLTLYAKWVSNVTSASYAVKHVRQSLDGTYNSVALTETESKNGTIGQLTAAAAKTYSGFTAETFSQETIKEDNSTVVTIKYKRNSYTIKFNSNGGSAVADIVKLYEENVTKPADPTKDGYTFAGWYTDAALTVPYSFSTMPLGGLTLYAKWSNETYTVYFCSEYSETPDASIITSQVEVNLNETVPEADIPSNYDTFGYEKNSAVDAVYTESYKHAISSSWWYLDGDEWKVFDDEVKITKNLYVFNITKMISSVADLKRLPAAFSTTIPYNLQTRLADSFKDYLWATRNNVEYAVNNTDYYTKLIEKLADPKVGLIDSNGNILNQKIDIGIYEIISADEIEAEIKAYIKGLINDGGSDLETVIEFVSLPEIASAVGTDEIIDYVSDAQLLSMVKHASMRNTLISVMKNKFKTDSAFRNATVSKLSDIIADDDDAMLELAAYVRDQYNSGNTEVVNFVNNTLGIPSLTYVTDAQIATALKTQISSIPEFMGQYIIYCINNNDPDVDGYVNEFIDNDLDVTMIGSIRASLVGDSDVKTIVEKYLEDEPVKTKAIVIELIESMNASDKAALSDTIFAKVSTMPTYLSFIAAFNNKETEFAVDANSVSFMLGVANAVNSYSYDDMRDKFVAKYGNLISFIGEDVVKNYFNSAKTDYYNGAVNLANEIAADKASGVSGTYSYKTYLTFKSNLMADVVIPRYNSAVAKAKDKLTGVEKVKYNENIYLKAIVEKDFIAALFDTTTANEIYSGYKLKDNPMAYYDLLYALVILADDAVLYYDYADYDTAFAKITPYAVKALNKLISVLDEFDKTGELPASIDSKLGSIEQLAGVYGAFEDILSAVADEVLKSALNQTYTEGEFKNQSVKAATSFINIILESFNDYAATGALPDSLKKLIKRNDKINELFESNSADLHALAEKLAQFKFNHVYTEEEVAEYEKYVQHIYTLLNEDEENPFTIDDMYEIVNVFFGDILASLSYTPAAAEGVANVDAYKFEKNNNKISVIRFFN